MGKNKSKKNKNKNSKAKDIIKKDIDKTLEENEDKQQKEEKRKPKQIIHRHSPHCKVGKKIKNLTALSILFAGFALGSLFVDIVQFYKKDGFSALALKSANIINYNGDTWVRYKQPKIVVDVVVSDDCKQECSVVDDLLSNLRSKIPTLEAHRINISKSENKNYIKENNITSIPTFLFDKNLKKINFFKEGELFLQEKKNGKVQIKMDELGIKTKKINNPETDELKDNNPKKQENKENKEKKKKDDSKKSSATSI